jgi:hypothetical protein
MIFLNLQKKLSDHELKAEIDQLFVSFEKTAKSTPHTMGRLSISMRLAPKN